MEEKFLYHIWDEGHLATALQTVSGKTVRINYSGQFNTFRGPDFVNAIINLDGEDLQGAVEIHLNTADWLKHNHQEDHFYNSVILHVVLVHNTAQQVTQKENGELVDILELQNQLSEDIQKLIRSYEDEPKKKRNDYCDKLSAIDNEHLAGILSLHGHMRFMGKVKRFNASLALSDFDQILYEGIMEAAGYDKNKFNLLQLAQSITYQNLQDWQNEDLDVIGLISILLCSSGLLAKSRNRVDQLFYDKIIAAYELQSFYARNLNIDCQLFRIRPSNHPLFSLVILAEFLFSCLSQGLLKHFLEEVELGSPDAKTRYTRFVELFQPEETGLLGAKTSLGKTLLNNIFINIYLPIMYLYAQKLANSELMNSIMTSYVSFGALPENYITRFMCGHINASQQKLTNGKTLYQQGLMDIYYRYCRYHLCGQCKPSGG